MIDILSLNPSNFGRNVFLITFRKNLLVTKDIDKKFCLFQINKIIVYFRLDKLRESDPNNPENIEFKHIIIIINRINFATMESKNDISLFLSFESIHIFHQNKFLLKLLESKNSAKIKSNNLSSYNKQYQINNDESENNKNEIKKYIRTFTHDENSDFF